MFICLFFVSVSGRGSAGDAGYAAAAGPAAGVDGLDVVDEFAEPAGAPDVAGGQLGSRRSGTLTRAAPHTRAFTYCLHVTFY